MASAIARSFVQRVTTAGAFRAVPRQATTFSSCRTFSMKFTESHEYATVEGGTATVGITDFAQSALGDIVFVDLPEVGDEFEKGEVYGSVESVKAASDVYAPIGGEVIEINEALGDEPGLVNSSAEGDAWFVKLKVKDESELGDLMDADAYEAHCKAQE